MYSISFPNIFDSARTRVVSDHEATLQNLKLMLSSDKNSLLGDPFFGTTLRRALYEQNGEVIVDLVIDEIYTSILTFMPQIQLNRRDIQIKQKGEDLYAEITCKNLIDYTTDMYDINLTKTDEVQ